MATRASAASCTTRAVPVYDSLPIPIPVRCAASGSASSEPTTVRMIRVMRARLGGSTATGGGGSSRPRCWGGSRVASHRRVAARSSISAWSGPGPPVSSATTSSTLQLEHVTGGRDPPCGREAAPGLEQRPPQQAGRPLVGERAVLVPEPVGQPSVVDRLVEDGAVLLGHLRPERLERVGVGPLGHARRGGRPDRGEEHVGELREAPVLDVVARREPPSVVAQVLVQAGGRVR